LYHHDPNYDTQAVRDLVWALSSPSLMDHQLAIGERWGSLEVSRNSGLLSRLDSRSSDLARSIKNRQSARLGEYFEILVTTWLDQIPPATLLASNRQVFRGSHTVGEFDLVFERDRAVHHWELAIKFYLGHPGRNDEPLWFGPNPKDRLDKKWRKMLSHQLRLAQIPAGKASLAQLGIDADVEPSAFIKGYLFDALDDQFAVATPEDASPHALHGWWVHRPELAAYADTLDPADDRKWMTLSRLRWMSPARISGRDKAMSFGKLAATLPTNNRAFLVAGLEETDEGWREVTRGFVVPEGWPRR
jgi:hypothetical protein